MKIPWKTRAALRWERLKEKKALLYPPMILKESSQPVRNLLVIMPANPDHTRFARMFTQSLRNAIGPQGNIHVRILARRKNLENIDSAFSDRLIAYTGEHLNKWGLPEHSFLDIVLPVTPDAVVDLNMDFDPVSATVVQKSHAPLRIGFYSEENEPYFNVLIDKKRTDYLENGFRLIQQLLGIS